LTNHAKINVAKNDVLGIGSSDTRLVVHWDRVCDRLQCEAKAILK